jgi:RNA polymerase sigma-70 factor (sigma-E family)
VVFEGGTLVAGGEGFGVAVSAPVLDGPGLEEAFGPVPAACDVVDATDLLSQLFDAHYRSLCRLAYVLLGDLGQSEDVVQEAFLRTFTGVGRLRDRSRADAYLRRSVVNLCRSRLRRRSVEDRGSAAAAWQASTSGWHGIAGDATPARPEPVVEPPSLRDPDLLAAVRALPPRQRAAVVLFYYADLPESEVASTLGCSVGTVKSQLAKARAALARCLGQHPEEGSQ